MLHGKYAAPEGTRKAICDPIDTSFKQVKKCCLVVQVSDLVYNSSTEQVQWRCLSGCASTPPSGRQVSQNDTAPWPASAIWSSDSSYGDAITFDGLFLAVGAPKVASEGTGYVHVWMAVGSGPADSAPVVDGNTRFEHWSRSAELLHDGVSAFGASLALRGGILVVGAPDAHNNASVHLYSISKNGEAVKLCDYWRPPGDFGESLAIQPGRGDRHTVVVGEPGMSRVYAISVNPNDQNAKCSMRSIIRQFLALDNPGDGFGRSLAFTHQFLFIGAPDIRRSDSQQNVISGLLHILAFCDEGNYLLADVYKGCERCNAGAWSAGSQEQQCTPCIPERAQPLQDCDFVCEDSFFGNDCLPCSQAMADGDKPAHSSWLDGESECRYSCDASYKRMGADCVKCGGADAEDHNGVWIPETCGWTCTETFFAAAGSAQPDCVPCSVFKHREGEEPPENAEWVDGLPTCEYGPKLGYDCSHQRLTNFPECIACPALAANAHWTSLDPTLEPRCEYACDQGFFGHPEFDGVCETCGVFLESVLPVDQRPVKPDRSIWDAASRISCNASTWVCIDGTHKSSTDEFCCPDFIKNSVADASARPCQVRCREGFWWNIVTASCDACFLLPHNAEWTEGNCTFRPKPGFSCEDRLCEPCSGTLPYHAIYVSSDVACTYECKAGYFGHPEYLGRCERCPIYREQVVDAAVRVDLPVHAAWEDGDNQTECTSDSWACADGYDKSETDLYCCPTQRDPNAVPYQYGRPCGLSCNPGFVWSNTEEGCASCPEPPDNSQWTYDVESCTYECAPGYHGGSDEGQCLNCRAYRHLIGSSPPTNSHWPEDSAICADHEFECEAGYTKNLETNPAGCCPNELPEGGSWGGPSSQCSIECASGWSWSAEAKTCVGCSAGAYLETPRSGEFKWDQAGSCEYVCVADSDGTHFFRYPPKPARIQECLSCRDLASRMQWEGAINGNSHWPADVGSCLQDAWACNELFVQVDGRCCEARLRPSDFSWLEINGRGGWMPDTCKWQCAEGYFPRVPQLPATSGTSCLKCENYLRNNEIPSCYDHDKPSGCDGKRVDEFPKQCVAQVEAEFILRGIAKEAFTAAVEEVFREGVADASQFIESGDVFVTSVEEKSGARRQAFSRQAALKVGVDIRSIEPYMASQIKTTMNSNGADALNRRLSRSGVAASVDPVVELQLAAGADTWGCAPPKVKNAYTGKCCRKGLAANADGSRYMWDSNGCDWTCRKGFLQRAPESECLTCSEYNELERRFKPANAKWRDDSADCSEWVCETGYVRSASGFSCVALSTLEAACGAFSRCAECVQDADCVWCDGQCRAGMQRGEQISCPYTSEGTFGSCNCEAPTCSGECNHKKCSDCIKDYFCGWCSSTETCMLGSYFRPIDDVCSGDEWLFNSDARCGSDNHIWMIGLICATGSVLLVAILGGFVVTRVRVLQRREQDRRAGRLPEQRELRARTQRFMSTFPTFKYNGKRLPMPQGPQSAPQDSSGNEDPGEDSDEPMCSICLVCCRSCLSCVHLESQLELCGPCQFVLCPLVR